MSSPWGRLGRRRHQSEGIGMERVRLLVALFVLLTFRAAHGEEPKEDRLAKQVAQAFMKSLNLRSLEGLMQVADVPFLGREGVIKDRAELKKFLKKALSEMPKEEKYPTQPVIVLAWGQVRVGIDVGKLVKEVDSILKPSDRLVGMGEGRGVYVRVRDGKATVGGGW